MADGTISCQQFADIFIRRLERFDALVKAVKPNQELMAKFMTGTFPNFSGTTHQFDRIERVVPDLTGAWEDMPESGCVGTPCDPSEKLIGFGSTRDTYSLKRRSYATDLYCFDQVLSADYAKEQFNGIVENLRDASVTIISDRTRLEIARIAGQKWVANAAMTPFTASWNSDMTEYTVSAKPTSLLTVPMLKRRVQPLISRGYFGEYPQGMELLLDLITDMDTIWSMTQGNTTLHGNWRFENFDDAAGKYYRMGWGGKVGNFAVTTDLFPIRFVEKPGSPLILKRVFPFKTSAATLGVKSVPDDAYNDAPYQLSYIHHRAALKFLSREAESINPEMPYLKRDLLGKWSFVMDNLGADANGCVISNKRRNKGQFIADFTNATKSEHPEWIESILHLREQGCVVEVNVCNTALLTSYTAQTLGAANAVCAKVFNFLATANGAGHYIVAANTIKINGNSITQSAVDQTTLAGLVTALNTVASAAGTWAVVSGSTTSIQVTSTANSIDLPFVI